MPNRNAHLAIGAVTGALRSCLAEPRLKGTDQFWNLVGGAIGGAVGGLLPDVLEPATSPHHRQFAHGVLPTLGVAALTRPVRRAVKVRTRRWAREGPLPGTSMQSTSGSAGVPRELRFLLLGAIRGIEAGYVSHLAADALTPKGLPLIGKL